MCRVFGCVAAEPVSIRHELLEAENPMVRQSEDHDSGWGMAVYRRTDGADPRLLRFPQAAFEDDGSSGPPTPAAGSSTCTCGARRWAACRSRTRTRSCSGNYSYCHNGTIMRYPRLARARRGARAGRHRLRALLQLPDARLRPRRRRGVACARTVTATVERSPFSGLNFLFSDGERLYAYRLGIFELHWRAEPGRLLVASERVTDRDWHAVQQDVLLVLDPEDLEEPHAERLVGDELWSARRHPEARGGRAPPRRRARRVGRGAGGQDAQPRPPSEPPLRAARQPGRRPAGGRSKALPAVTRRARPRSAPSTAR